MLSVQKIKTFSTLSKILHWLIACVVIAMLSFGFFMSGLADAQKPIVYMLHKSFGLSVLALTLMRMVWLHHRGRPELPVTVKFWEKKLSQWVQYSLYLLLLLMPLCGWVMSTAANRAPMFWGMFSLPFPGIAPNEGLAQTMSVMHETMAWFLIGLISLHVAGALKHHLIDKDNVLRRMWFTWK